MAKARRAFLAPGLGESSPESLCRPLPYGEGEWRAPDIADSYGNSIVSTPQNTPDLGVISIKDDRTDIGPTPEGA
ncbi:hypothetical protein D9611_008272 [Ephemerocybe angulata]|uniref:Uncharacterized protein n=1 Tax=Ephemerocybe angulata TaxID=980116 RepID=A0A8H5BIA8_9AGAR|nr:hypothetical protein D9611_008272 [Tulosesus angulatus]